MGVQGYHIDGAGKYKTKVLESLRIEEMSAIEKIDFPHATTLIDFRIHSGAQDESVGKLGATSAEPLAPEVRFPDPPLDRDRRWPVYPLDEFLRQLDCLPG
jgi:hypothetical protein